MTRFERLRREGKDAATWRGHTLAKFVRTDYGEGRMVAVAGCIHCARIVGIDTKPLPNGIECWGGAVAVGCNPAKV